MSIGSPICSGEEVVRAAPSVGAVSIDEAKARWRDVMSAEGKSVRTIAGYADRLKWCADHADWLTVDHVGYEAAMAFIAARMRNDHEGKAWENGACRSAISALKCFGKFLKASGLRKFDPLEGIALPKRRAQVHKHPFTVDEARAMIQASLTRQTRDKRTKGHAALVWATLFWTGLRHSEIQAPAKDNPYGGLKWRDVTLEGAEPGIRTDPRWIGNKSKSVDWIPLHPRLAALLIEHKAQVMNRPGDPVFPHWPVRATWIEDRTRGGLPSHDKDGRPLSVHSTRATFCTWIGQLTLPEGLRDRLTRHELGIAERVYTDRDRADLGAAVAQLPDIWPPSGGFPYSNPESSPQSPKALDNQTPIGILSSATQYDHPLHKHSERPPPAGSRLMGWASVVPAGTRGGQVSVEPSAPGIESLNPDLAIHLDPTTAKRALETLNLLVRCLAPPRLPPKGVSDDDGKQQRSA